MSYWVGCVFIILNLHTTIIPVNDSYYLFGAINWSYIPMTLYCQMKIVHIVIIRTIVIFTHIKAVLGSNESLTLKD